MPDESPEEIISTPEELAELATEALGPKPPPPPPKVDEGDKTKCPACGVEF